MRQGSLKIRTKIASQADSWYNVEVIKYCMPPRWWNNRRRESILLGELTMDILYPHDQNDNPLHQLQFSFTEEKPTGTDSSSSQSFFKENNFTQIDIRAIRKQKGYTQAEIAAKIGTSVIFLHYAEKGTKFLTQRQKKIIEDLPSKEKFCIGCGKNLIPFGTRPDKEFCSQSCWIQYRNSQVYERHCPQCDAIMTYKAYNGWQQAEKHKRVCKKCQAINFTGEKNPFYGQSHSQASRDKISVKAKGKRHSPNTEFKKGQKTLNKTPLYEIWLQKYGQEEADKRFQQFKQKQSLANSGSKNSMYGKPSPSGSGNGWSGWYKGFYFRSLHELSYIVNVLEKQGFSFESAEQRKYRISYIDWDGKPRNYFADFIVENRLMVECKPKHLHASKTVLLKEEAARLFCANIGLDYEIISPSKLTDQEIRDLYISGLLQWLPRYQQKYEERYEK